MHTTRALRWCARLLLAGCGDSDPGGAAGLDGAGTAAPPAGTGAANAGGQVAAGAPPAGEGPVGQAGGGGGAGGATAGTAAAGAGGDAAAGNCGCDGATFSGIGSCPGDRYLSEGPCGS